MTEAEFEGKAQAEPELDANSAEGADALSAGSIAGADQDASGKSPNRAGRSAGASRSRTAKPRRIQRMFAIEEDLDRKLWLYAIHMGKDRSEIVNDLLRPVVASMVVYDSRDRRGSSSVSGNANLAESA